MDKTEIKKTWNKLLIPFILGILILVCSIIFNRYGSKRATPQMLSFFGGVFGFMLILFSGFKIFQFNKFLNSIKK